MGEEVTYHHSPVTLSTSTLALHTFTPESHHLSRLMMPFMV